MSKKGLGKFLTGIGLGVGLGILFAPDKGCETRKKLKEKLDELMLKVKELDKEDVKMAIEEKINEIKEELEDLDKEKVIAIAKKKAEQIKIKLDELTDLAKEKATPIINDTIEELRENAIKATKEVLKKLEDSKKDTKKLEA